MSLDRLLAAPGQARRMEELVTILQHGIGRHVSPVWATVLAAVVLAVFDHAAKMRRMRPYDAWWQLHLLRPPRKR